MSNKPLTPEYLQELYESAVSAEHEENQHNPLCEEYGFALLDKLEEIGGMGHVIRRLIDLVRANNTAAQAAGVRLFAEHPALGILSCQSIALEFADQIEQGKIK